MKKIFDKLGILGTLGAILLMVSIVAAGLTCRALLQLTSNGGLTGVGTFVKGANQTIAKVNAPCTDFHGDYTCGPIEQLSQMEKNFGIVAGKTAEQVQQSGQLVTGAVVNMNDVAVHIKKLIDALTGTAGAFTDTAKSGTKVLDQAATDLKSAQPTIAATKPLVAASTETVQNTNKLVIGMTPDMTRFMKSSADGMDKMNVGLTQFNGIATDTHKMTTHLEKDVDAKTPWWKKTGRTVVDLIHIASTW